jgi:hypothetical protein
MSMKTSALAEILQKQDIKTAEEIAQSFQANIQTTMENLMKEYDTIQMGRSIYFCQGLKVILHRCLNPAGPSQMGIVVKAEAPLCNTCGQVMDPAVCAAGEIMGLTIPDKSNLHIRYRKV